MNLLTIFFVQNFITAHSALYDTVRRWRAVARPSTRAAVFFGAESRDGDKFNQTPWEGIGRRGARRARRAEPQRSLAAARAVAAVAAAQVTAGAGWGAVAAARRRRVPSGGCRIGARQRGSNPMSNPGL